jgi:carbamoyltransferase
LKTAILGISAFYHDSAACLLLDGEIIAAAQEERFSRIKNDPSFPSAAVEYVLKEADVKFAELTHIAFYDKPLLKFERLLENYHSFVPHGMQSFVASMPVWIREKLFMKKMLRKQLSPFGDKKIPLLFPEHHLSHAASAFYPSPFEEAAILTIDGVGEWATTTISYGNANQIRVLRQMDYPHSLGLLYASFTAYLGFKVNSGEYKLMGLAPFGNPDAEETKTFREKILDQLLDIREDGSLLLNMEYFDFATSLQMTNNKKWQALFGFAARTPESEIQSFHKNLAWAIQNITETIVVMLAKTAAAITGSKNLVMAGGVALNCVANSKTADAGIFDDIWIQPASGDAGGALGAALAAWHIGEGQPKNNISPDKMKGAMLGPSFQERDILNLIRHYDAPYEFFDHFKDLTEFVAGKISAGDVIGWFQGRMEFGPRALGNRSILADPRNPDMQRILNVKIKFRETFRPFAPAVLAEDASEYFDGNMFSPYMLFVNRVREKYLRPHPAFPAITHADHTARVQIIDPNIHPRFWQLISSFKKITGCGMLINTSFNVRGEPMVCTPQEAFIGFMRTDMDYLVIGNYVFEKKKQNARLFQSFSAGGLTD